MGSALQHLDANRLIFQSKAELFDDRIGEHFACDALHLGVGGGGVESIVEREDEILSLRTSSTPRYCIFFNALWIVWPCGSRTVRFNVT